MGPLALKVTFTPDDLQKYTTAECTVNVDVIPRKFRQANTSYIDNKKIGTAFEDLGLPNAFYFFAEADEPNHEGSGLNGNVPGIIKWDDSNYDPNSYEEQTIYGEVNRAEFEKYYIVPEGADLRGVVKVTLQADPVETEITQLPVFRWKNGDFTLPDNTMFVNRIFEMGATGGGSANLADGVARVKGTDTVVPGTFSFKEGTSGWFDELGENVVTVVFTPTDQHGYRTAETTIKVNVIKNTFKRCEEPDPITEKKLGTTFAGLNLPEIVVVEAIDGLRVGMEVSWEESSYDAQSTAWQTIPGTLVFDANDEHKYQQPEPAVTAAIRVNAPRSGGCAGDYYHDAARRHGRLAVPPSASGKPGEASFCGSFSVASVPDGLTLKQTTGEISGTPTAAGTASFTVKAENSAGSDTKELSIAIAKAAPAEHTVRFNANGGGGTMADVTGVSGSYTLPSCGFTEPEGKQFKGWSTSADGSVISGTTYEVSSDTTFYAIWESKEYSIIVTDGKATIGAGSEISKAAQGTTITLTANAAPDGKVFDKWVVESGSATLEDANSETTTFIMPDSEVSVKATYKNAPVTTYSLTTQVNGGHGTISASKTGLTEGSTETVTFTPDDGYEIDLVTVNGVVTDVLSNILNVTMDADKTVIVTYKAIPHTHTYDQEIQKPETLKSAADCTNDAVYFKSCSCGEISTTETFTAAGTQLGHAWASDWGKDTDNHWKECSRCHEKKDEAAHDYGSDNICDTCGYDKTVPHTHNLTLVPAKAPTCTEKGNTAYYTCDGCDKWFEDATGASEITDKTSVILAATGHSVSDWKSDHTDHWKECTVVGCGVIIEDSKAAHTAGEWIIDTPATATTSGSKHKECTVCGYMMATETIPATGGGEHTHSYGSDWKYDADNHWHECSCGDKADKAAHDFKWVVDKEATATQKGFQA